MNYKLSKTGYVCEKHKGIVLLFTLVLLVVLATLGYMLTTRVRAQQSREKYMIDYQRARYACDSAIKYADSAFKGLSFKLVSRPNEPDFSDIFSLTDEEYQELIDIWSEELDYTSFNDFNDVNDINDNNANKNGSLDLTSVVPFGEFGDINDINDPNFKNPFDSNALGDLFNQTGEVNEPNEIIIRGPYGPEWPYVAEPIEFEIGTAKVTVEIVDENAKYPIGWALIEDDDLRDEAIAGFEGFCEWMDVNSLEIEQILADLDAIREVKEFQVEFKATKEEAKAKDPNEPEEDSKSSKRTRSRRNIRRNVKRTKETKKEIPVNTHIADFARLLNSSIVDPTALSRPTQISDERNESALKYTSLWPVGKVNVNTAPRHVLEAAFIFGGDQVEIAEEIIIARRQKTFADIKELKKTIFEYSNSIEKCEKFITTESDFFTVRITAVSGAAKVTSVLALKKAGKRFEVIAVISD